MVDLSPKEHQRVASRREFDHAPLFKALSLPVNDGLVIPAPREPIDWGLFLSSAAEATDKIATCLQRCMDFELKAQLSLFMHDLAAHSVEVSPQIAPLRDGLASTLGVLVDFAGDVGDLDRKPVELSARLEWHRLELNLLRGNFFREGNSRSEELQALEDGCQLYRNYFEEDSVGRPKGWLESRDPTGSVQHLNATASALRELGGELYKFRDHLQEMDQYNPEEISKLFLKFRLELFRIHLNLYETMPGATGLKCPVAGLIGKWWDLTRDGLEHMVVKSPRLVWQDMKAQYSQIAGEHLQELRPHRDEVERPELLVATYSSDIGPPHRRTLARIEEIERSYLIDNSRLQPQLGFASGYDIERLSEVLSGPSAKLVTMRLGDVLSGYYLIFTGTDGAPDEVREIFDTIREEGGFRREKAGWVDCLCASRDAQQKCRKMGVGANSVMLDAVVATGRSLGLDALYGYVREGKTANPAKKVHLRKGAKETGIWTQYSGRPYQILRFDLNPESR